MTELPQHLISIDQLSKIQIESIIEKALSLIDRDTWSIQKSRLCAHRTIMNLFYEPSTRTQNSFQLAAHYLGAHALSWHRATSAEQKGEVFLDTLNNLAAMWVDLLIIRHPNTETLTDLPEPLSPHIRIINAGNGSDEHPTQALLDAATILDRFGRMDDLKISIVGDIRHSRAAHSQIKCFKTLGAKAVTLIGPESFLPSEPPKGVTCHQSLADGIIDSDVVIALRLQKERLAVGDVAQQEHLAQCYMLTEAHMAKAKSHAILMHPGPVNRGIELDSALMDGPQSVILKQVGYGVAVRMALLMGMLAR